MSADTLRPIVVDPTATATLAAICAECRLVACVCCVETRDGLIRWQIAALSRNRLEVWRIEAGTLIDAICQLAGQVGVDLKRPKGC